MRAAEKVVITTEHMVRIADKLFGDDYSFSAFAAGRDQLRFAPTAPGSAVTCG
ncbi:hypothetical protein LWP59_24740 [Amycolatopsis acidiphila]|uniref:hypothetical protein n=1 Tax=Amycolatopsis acidiphila TaxID=715473 RepID=UPI0019B7D7C6|nr:hypothetical protein [Amycolatopsis acidiphila]UIJ57353.1 hypothetical protein LWP59_24740 [Amycolatopsis acidiphila]GHG84645.1 hypothetical protein GCM10017788_56920 [Amycolatopsis acidiphila]